MITGLPTTAAVIEHPAVRLVCPKCGTEAGCNCGVAPIERAAYALLKNPGKSDRAIAAEIGVGKSTVSRARKTSGPPGPVEKRVGRDGRARRLPRKPRSSVTALASSCRWPQASAAMQTLVGEYVNSARGERLRQVLLLAELLNVADAVSVARAVPWPESASAAEVQP